MSRELLGKLKTRIPEPRAPVTSRTVAACLSPQNKVNQNNELMMVGSWVKERPRLRVQDGEELSSTCIQKEKKALKNPIF